MAEQEVKKNVPRSLTVLGFDEWGKVSVGSGKVFRSDRQIMVELSGVDPIACTPASKMLNSFKPPLSAPPKIPPPNLSNDQKHVALGNFVEQTDEQLYALVNFDDSPLGSSCRWQGGVRKVAASSEDEGKSACIVVAVSAEHSLGTLVNLQGDLIYIDWTPGEDPSFQWVNWQEISVPLAGYMVDAQGGVSKVDMTAEFLADPSGDSDSINLRQMSNWQSFVPYLHGETDQLICVDFGPLESYPSFESIHRYDERRLRTLTCIGLQRFFARAGDCVEMTFKKTGLPDPIVIACA